MGWGECLVVGCVLVGVFMCVYLPVWLGVHVGGCVGAWLRMSHPRITLNLFPDHYNIIKIFTSLF